MTTQATPGRLLYREAVVSKDEACTAAEAAYRPRHSAINLSHAAE